MKATTKCYCTYKFLRVFNFTILCQWTNSLKLDAYEKLVFYSNISSCFRDIGFYAYRGHDLTFQGHVTSSVTWPFDSAQAISYCWSPGMKSLSTVILEILGSWLVC